MKPIGEPEPEVGAIEPMFHTLAEPQAGGKRQGAQEDCKIALWRFAVGHRYSPPFGLEIKTPNMGELPDAFIRN